MALLDRHRARLWTLVSFFAGVMICKSFVALFGLMAADILTVATVFVMTVTSIRLHLQLKRELP